MKRSLCSILTLIAGLGLLLQAHEAHAFQGLSVAQDDDSQLLLQVSSHHLKFSGGSSRDLEIFSNTSWAIKVQDSWITTTSSFGEGDATVTVLVAPNDSDSERIGELTIYTEGIGRSIVVNQAGSATRYQLELTAENGAIQTSESDHYVLAGQAVELTAVPEEGYTFEGWSGDIAGADNPLSVVMEEGLIIEAVFIEAPDEGASEQESATGTSKAYKLTVNNIGQGETMFSETYVNGDTVTVSAKPKDGWVFAGWTGDIVADGEEIEIIVNKDQSITAAFEKLSYDLTTSTEHGSIERFPRKDRFLPGERVTLVAEPKEGYEFVGWDGIIAQNKKITLPVYSNIEVKALFRKISDVYAIQVEAEDFTAHHGALMSRQIHGFSGEGQMFLQEKGSYLEYSMHVPVPGKTDLMLTYLGANGSQIHLFVNGALHSSVDLPNSGPHWNMWETTVDLLQGKNTIRIMRKQADIAIDYLEVSNVIPEPDFGRGASMVIYPNPATNFLNLSIPADVVITDSKGTPVIEGKNMDRINVEDLEAGLYLLSSEGQVSEVTIKD